MGTHADFGVLSESMEKDSAPWFALNALAGKLENAMFATNLPLSKCPLNNAFDDGETFNCKNKEEPNVWSSNANSS
jgi:hypothetical protein